MARHNREGEGEDQKGFVYRVSYQPDWLRHVKIARTLPTGRQSTKTLFRNPQETRARVPGTQVRTRITCPEQGVDVEVVVRCSRRAIQRVTVACEVPSDPEAIKPGAKRGAAKKGTTKTIRTEEICFILENGLPPGS